MNDYVKAKQDPAKPCIVSRMIAGARAIRSYYQRWTSASTDRKIFGAAGTVAVMTGIAKLVSLAKEAVVAASFGTNDVMDAFIIAFMLPSFATNVVAGSFNPALIPTYIQVREKEGKAAAQQLFSSVLLFSIAILLGVVVILGIVSPYVLPILSPGFGPEKMATTLTLFYILLPTVVITGVGVIFGAILNAWERFSLPAIAPVMISGMTIVLVLTMGDRWGIRALALGTILGFLAEMIYLLIGLYRSNVGLPWVTIKRGRYFGTVVKNYLPLSLAALITGGSNIVDNVMAAMLKPGDVAVLSFANKVPAVLIGIGAMGLGRAVLPYVSEMVAQGDYGGLNRTIKRYYRLILILTIPTVMLLVLFSKPITQVFFQRGMFTAADTARVYTVQSILFLQIPLYIIGIFQNRLVVALGNTRVFILLSIITLSANALLDYALMGVLGAKGIALSTVFVSVINCVIMGYVVKRTVKEEKVGAIDSHSGLE